MLPLPHSLCPLPLELCITSCVWPSVVLNSRWHSYPRTQKVVMLHQFYLAFYENLGQKHRMSAWHNQKHLHQKSLKYSVATSMPPHHTGVHEVVKAIWVDTVYSSIHKPQTRNTSYNKLILVASKPPTRRCLSVKRYLKRKLEVCFPVNFMLAEMVNNVVSWEYNMSIRSPPSPNAVNQSQVIFTINIVVWQ